MSKTTIVIITLVLYKLVLLAIGLWASKRTLNSDDYLLAGRNLGPIVAALSYSSSASSAWTLLGVSGIAYAVGLSSIWVAFGAIAGMLVAWFWIAPRLMASSRLLGQVTPTDFLMEGVSGSLRQPTLWLISGIIIFSFIFYIAAQFQGVGNTFASVFAFSSSKSILLGAFIIMLYTMLGGFWAVSITDALQGFLMLFAAVLLPLIALSEVGGIDGLIKGLQVNGDPSQLSFVASNVGLSALGVALGGLSVGIGTVGQPHLLVRFMALRDEAALRQARLIAVAWYLFVFMGMWILGLIGFVVHTNIANPESIFLVLTESLLSPVLGAILLAAVLSAILSTADSQLLSVAAVISHDLGLGGRSNTLLVARISVVALVIAAVVVSIYLPDKIFDRVVFAWVALGSAFGPLVFVRLAALSIRSGGVFLSVLVGFSCAVIFSFVPDIHQFLKRAGPFFLALAVLLLSKEEAESI